MASAIPSPIYILQERLTCQQILDLEAGIRRFRLRWVESIAEARLILANVNTSQRAAFELRKKGLWTQTAPQREGCVADSQIVHDSQLPDLVNRSLTQIKIEKLKDSSQVKPPSIDHSAAKSEGDNPPASSSPSSQTLDIRHVLLSTEAVAILVVSTRWMNDSLRWNSLQPLAGYEVFRGFKAPKPTASSQNFQPHQEIPRKRLRSPASDFLAKADHPKPRSQDSDLSSAVQTRQEARFSRPSLRARSTSEIERHALPPVPEWVRKRVKYSCQRVTTRNGPNAAFIKQLKKIQKARALAEEEIHVRAYSTKIASVAAYPYRITSSEEILRLPGCNEKTMSLWSEWETSADTDDQRNIKEVMLWEQDSEQQTIKLFNDIWGVGVRTAKEFYHDRGWRSLDDIVDKGWNALHRSQQIGVKFFDEFQEKMPRDEVESIAAAVYRVAKELRGEQMQMCIVGGYRRGQEFCGDCDIMLTHPDEAQTVDLIEEIVVKLEEEAYITHTLTLSTNTSSKEQMAKPLNPTGARTFRLKGGYAKDRSAGGPQRHSFDTLDKAFVVWQNPDWPGKDQALRRGVEHGERVRNPNPHRRVDILVSPWKTIGCAIVGWSGGTTLERDLRSYVDKKFNYKFDSGGVTNRINGKFVDVEGANAERGWGPKKTWQEAEKRVFTSLELDWLKPDERVTE